MDNQNGPMLILGIASCYCDTQPEIERNSRTDLESIDTLQLSQESMELTPENISVFIF